MFRVYWNKFMVPYWPLTITAVVSFIIASAASLGAPLIIKLLIDVALDNEDLHYLNLIVIGIIVLYTVRAIFYYIYSYNMAKAGDL